MEVAAHKPAANRVVSHLKPVNSAGAQKRSGRSKVTNGKKFVLGVDQRNPWIRRTKDIAADHLAETPNADAVARRRIRCIAVMSNELELMERKFALARTGADPADLDLYQKTSKTLRQYLSDLRESQRQPLRDVTPDLYADVLPSLAAQHNADHAANGNAADDEAVQ